MKPWNVMCVPSDSVRCSDPPEVVAPAIAAASNPSAAPRSVRIRINYAVLAWDGVTCGANRV